MTLSYPHYARIYHPFAVIWDIQLPLHRASQILSVTCLGTRFPSPLLSLRIATN
jgi:hypothetical protein